MIFPGLKLCLKLLAARSLQCLGGFFIAAFRTLAVQKRSSEVWQVLRGVKREFDAFADTLEKTQSRLEQANRELDNLVGVRTRQMQKQLAKVQTEDAVE